MERTSDHPRRFRFGLNLSQAESGKDWRNRCRDAEDLGYSSILIPDHFNQQLAPFSALAVAAAATKSARVGMLVACNDYRHPRTYAKELATLDVLSNGRTEWSIGAGWWDAEYREAGISFDPPGVRVERLRESVHLMRKLFTGDPVTHEGTHYTTAGVANWPATVQRPHPPLLIGGSARRLLSFAAREADIVGVNTSFTTRSMFGQPAQHTPLEATEMQIGWLRSAAPDRFPTVELNMAVHVIAITDDRSAAASRLAESTGLPPDALLGAPYAWLGSVDEICDQLRATRERFGISYWVLPAHLRDLAAPIVARLHGT